MIFRWILLLWMLVSNPAGADLSADEQALLEQLDTARVVDDTRVLSEQLVINNSGAGAGSVIAGSDDERQLADWMADRFAALGLEVRRQPFPVRKYTYGPVRLEMTGQSLPAITFHSGGGTWGTLDGVEYRLGNRQQGRALAVPLVDAGHGLRADYQHLGDVAGKAVLVRWTRWPGYLIQEAIVHGAAAIILHSYPGRTLPDALKQNTVIGRDAIPAVHISENSAKILLDRLARGAVDIELENRVDAAAGFSENVIGTVRGIKYPDEWLLVAAHHDRWFQGAQDNAVGSAVMLELGRVLLQAGKPRRSLALVAVGSEETGGVETEYDWLTGSYALVRAHPEIIGRVVYGFNVDGAGWSAPRGHLYTSEELVPFQRAILDDLGLSDRVSLQHGVNDVVDAWTFATIGAASMAYLLWFESHSVDSGLANSYSQYYHTQHDVYRAGQYDNLAHDLRVGLLSLRRADRADALPVRLSALGQWVGEELEKLQLRLTDQPDLFETVLVEARAFTHAAIALERSGGDHRAQVLDARQQLVPWLYSQSSSAAVLQAAPLVEDYLLLGEVLAALGRQDTQAATRALAQVSSLAWGVDLSAPAYARERLAAYSRPDWSGDYGHTPPALAPDIHAIYLSMARGDHDDGWLERLTAMRVARLEQLMEKLFVLRGKLAQASRLLAEP